jgi:hypothetical protein
MVFVFLLSLEDSRFFLGGTLVCAILAVVGYGLAIAVRTTYVYAACSILILLAFILAGRENSEGAFILAISAFAIFVVACSAWGWVKLMSGNT